MLLVWLLRKCEILRDFLTFRCRFVLGNSDEILLDLREKQRDLSLETVISVFRIRTNGRNQKLCIVTSNTTFYLDKSSVLNLVVTAIIKTFWDFVNRMNDPSWKQKQEGFLR